MDPPLQVPLSALAPNLTNPVHDQRTHHVLTGSFRSLSLYLLAFNAPEKSLSLVQTIPGFGPHQYLARNSAGTKAYSTSWANPPILSSWDIVRDGDWSVRHITNSPITATSSYIVLDNNFAYSTGGPCGEVHQIDENGVLGTKVHEFLFNGITSEELHSDAVDKSKKALRIGSHGIEFAGPPSDQPDAPRLAFVPHLTPSEIYVYTVDESTGTLNHVSTSKAPPRVLTNKSVAYENDGPRHVKIHPNGKILYCVTEHSNYLDLYTITYAPTPSLTYHSSRSIIPHSLRGNEFLNIEYELVDYTHFYRGDTLIVTPTVIFSTTRGKDSDWNGILHSVSIDENGFFAKEPDDIEGEEWWDTPTSGGKANALDVIPSDSEEGVYWILLTDDDDAVAEKGGAVRVLEWSGFGKDGPKIIAGWPSPGEDLGERGIEGGSHAIWLD
ncbi:hypothetical protein DL96DRAFT_1670814 [Flagelloscypha sp. PMI_526]|nr:hypothetical protein DL96DRAFT_1670814 [Flagelloscypha sp. PMI_526]